MLCVHYDQNLASTQALQSTQFASVNVTINQITTLTLGPAYKCKQTVCDL